MTANIICPRCEGYIPCNENPGQYPGAISRTDNVTEICSDCGTEEALISAFPHDSWPITDIDHPSTYPAHKRFMGRLGISVGEMS